MAILGGPNHVEHEGASSVYRIMPSLSYNVDPRCNMACVYCPPFYENLQESLRRFPRELACAFFQAAASAGFVVFRLSGGEPLLSPQHVLELAEVVRTHASAPEAEVRLNTNGFFLGKYAAALQAAGINVLKVSLDTLDRAKFHRMTKVDALPDVLEGIRIAQSLGMWIELNMVYTRENAEDVWGLLAFCREIGVTRLKVLDLVQYDDPEYWSANYISPQGLLDALTEQYGPPAPSFLSSGRGVRMLEFRREAMPTVLVKDCRQGSTYSRSFCAGCHLYPCQEGFYNLTLNSDGKLKPCRLRNDISVDLVDVANLCADGPLVAAFGGIIDDLLQRYYGAVFFERGWVPVG